MALENIVCDVSIIVPIYNGERWIDRCFESIINQTVVSNNSIHLEVVVFNDSSTDGTSSLLDVWRNVFLIRGINYIILSSDEDFPKGVGAAKNNAVKKSSGTYLCFQDVDDVMLPMRIERQLNAAKRQPHTLIGSKFRRDPPGSTVRFAEWANNLDQEQLNIQIYTSHGPTIIMPTWFCHRDVYERVEGFVENKKGTPEDLIFFFKFIQLGGRVIRVDEELLIYTYHSEATTFSVLSDTIWDIRMSHLQEEVINKWTSFSVWNAGKQGRKFVRSLKPINQNKVKALCDVDAKKVGTEYSLYCACSKKFTKTFPIVHFKDVVPPIVICVKLGLTNGDFESNLKSLNLCEGSDYIMFS